MLEKYINYVKAFNELDLDDKKEEIINHFKELIQLVYSVNKDISDNNELLPVYNYNTNDDEFLNQIFTYIITLKEENAKMIEYVLECRGK